MAYLTYLAHCACFACVIIAHEQSSTKLGRTIVKASELVCCFGGVAYEGGLKGGVGFFSWML